jgi:hypothetical protein
MSVEEKLAKLEEQIGKLVLVVGKLDQRVRNFEIQRGPDTNYKPMQQRIEQVGKDYYRSSTGGSQSCKYCGSTIVWDVNEHSETGTWVPHNPDGSKHQCRSH